MTLDLLVRRATVPGLPGTWDLGIDVGRIISIVPSSGAAAPSPARRAIDADGYLVLEPGVDGHVHLDKSLAGASWQSLQQARDWREKSRFGEALLASVVEPTLEDRILLQAQHLLDRGTVAARTHATVTSGRGLANVKACLQARERLAGILALQVVAFPQYGTSADGVQELLEEAVSLGCEVVGGNDPATYDQDIEAQFRVLFGVAERTGASIDVHLHDNGHLGRFEIERFCAWTVAEGMQGRTAISHAVALGDLDPAEIGETLEALAAADVAVIVPANLDVSMAPIHRLEAAGVRVGLGSDAAHAVLPFGTGDMMRKANLIAQRAIITSDAGLERLWERVSRDTARLLGGQPSAIVAGAPAMFLLARARNIADAVASPPADRVTIVGGRLAGAMGAGWALVAAT